MTSHLKQPSNLALDQRDIFNYMYTAKNVKTQADAAYASPYQILEANDLGEIIEYGALSSAVGGFTLPNVGQSQNGHIYHILNDSYYNLTIQPYGTEHIWNSGDGYGIELPEKGTMVSLRYNHSGTRWDIINKTGGKVILEGLKLHMVPDPGTRYQNSSLNYQMFPDRTGKHTGQFINDSEFHHEANAKFPPSHMFFSASGHGAYPDSLDWDICNSKTGHKTVALWLKPTNLSVLDRFVSQIEGGGTDWWRLQKNGDNTYAFYWVTTAGTNFDMTGGTVTEDWTHVAVIFNGGDVGLYVNGLQVDYDNSAWATGTVAGSLYIASTDSGNDFFAGRIQDLHISYQNPYNVTPTVGLDGHFPNLEMLEAPFQGVML